MTFVKETIKILLSYFKLHSLNISTLILALCLLYYYSLKKIDWEKCTSFCLSVYFIIDGESKKLNFKLSKNNEICFKLQTLLLVGYRSFWFMTCLKNFEIVIVNKCLWISRNALFPQFPETYAQNRKKYFKKGNWIK